MSSLFDLSGSTALVTGASRGIGLAVAGALADAGADVIAVSRSLPTRDSAVEARVRAAGRDFEGYAVDFGDRTAVEAFAAELGSRPIDILVNNAGTIERAPALEHPLDSWDRVLQTDLSSQFVLTRSVARGMLQRQRGRILFTTSLLSFQGGINVAGYTTAKSGLAGLVRALSNEWAPSGVTVNGIAPGYVATDNTRALRENPERAGQILDRIPAGRWGRPDDLAGAVVFLASPSAAYVTGAILPVDGGWLAR